ncbi:MAG: peptide chain release factor-like protein [Candidatus Omnitrophota bacterium]
MPALEAFFDKEGKISRKLQQLGVKESDVIEKFIRSRGPGGQNVNKTSTCVYLKHIPTGIEVKFQRERKQAQNRYLAWSLLLDKIESFSLEKLAEEREAREKLKRKSRKKPRRVKLRILEAKRRNSEKKLLRAKIHGFEE